MKKKIFKLTAKELKVLRAGRSTAGGCNGASWSASAARTGGAAKVAPGRPKVLPAKPKPRIKK